MRPADYLRIIRRRWWVLLVTVVIAMTFVMLMRPSSSDAVERNKPGLSFKATATLINNFGDTSVRGRDYDRLALLMTTGEVPQRVADAIDKVRWPQIQAAESAACATTGERSKSSNCPRSRRPVKAGTSVVSLGYQGFIKASAVPDPATGSLAITAQVGDAKLAAKVANLFAEKLIAYVDELGQNEYYERIFTLTVSRNNAETLLREIDLKMATPLLSASEYDSLGIRREATLRKLANSDYEISDIQEAGPQTSGLVTLESASRESTTVLVTQAKGSSSESTGLLYGAAFGFIIGLGILLLLEILSARIRDVPGTEGAARMPVIAEIPVMNLDKSLRFQITTAADPTSLMAEAYRSFRTSLVAMWHRHPVNNPSGKTGSQDTEPLPLRLLLVTSPGPAEGKSISVVNLAAAFAETGMSVVIIDGDFRRPQVHKYFSNITTPNLSDLPHLATSSDLEGILQETGIPNIRFVASAPTRTDPGSAIEMVRVASRVGREIADLVIVDSPPILLANDAAELSTFCDATILMVRAGWTRRGGVVAASDLLRRLEATTVGIVLVGAEHGARAGYYGYYGYYGYGYGYAHPGEVPKMSRLFPWRKPTRGEGTVRRQPDSKQVGVGASIQGESSSSEAFDDTSA
ncbi:unannotated protein [freshwater metagenome]|uniref:Unannotated protein n=1 Tax=freshwater metagenome TaxID=449393 RepID=A0A6J7K3N0_9ZZZZ|nr:hypothetical protein [Actinomycetota bacterium]